MRVIETLENSIILSSDNGELLGINMGISSRGTAGTHFSEVRRDSGYILKGGEIVEFNLPMITEIDNRVIIYSEDFNSGLQPLFNSTQDFSTVKELIFFYKTLKKHGIEVNHYSTNLFLRTKDGDLIMMPPRVIEFINARESLGKELHDLSKYRHPDLKGERGLLFSLGILLFEHSTSTYPIDFDSVEDLRDKIRRKIFLKPRWIKPEIINEFATIIEDLLNIKKSKTLDELYRELEEFSSNSIVGEEPTAEEIKRLYNSKERFLKEERKRTRYNNNRGKLIGIGVGVAIFLSLFGTAIIDRFKPPLTEGFTQIEVIEAYLNSFNLKDVELLKDTLKEDVREGNQNQLATVYITERMRAQYDESDKIYTPEEWYNLSDAERSEADVFGVYNSVIEDIGNNRYVVSYEKWITKKIDKTDKTMVSERTKMEIEEIFTLEETKYSWVISHIEILTVKEEIVW